MSEEKELKEETPIKELNAEMQQESEMDEGKERLSPEEATTHESPLEKMMRKQAEVDAKMMELAKQLEEEGFAGHSYGENSVVQIPGPEFAKYSNFLSTLQKNLGTIQYSINAMFQMAEGLVTACAEYQLEFMEMHLGNCKAGITSSKEEMDREDALKETVEVNTQGEKVEIEEEKSAE